MHSHFNIAKGLVVNPFDGVNYIKLSNNTNCSISKVLNKSKDVTTRKINGIWCILFSTKSLDFTTLINWYDTNRGKFRYKGSSVHFSIEGDVMNCW